jgi:RNA polymerase sigma factor (sigma-70 family)
VTRAVVALVEENLALAKRASWRFIRRYPGVADIDEAYSAALSALWTAARRFDPSLGVPFPPFAVPIINWAIRARIFHPSAPARDAKLYEICGERSAGEDGERVHVLDLADERAARLEGAAAPPLDRQDALLAQIRAAVADLPPRERKIIHLRFFDGLERHEVAQRLRISLPSVRRFQFRAVQRLRERFPGALPPDAPIPPDGNRNGCPAAVRKPA